MGTAHLGSSGSLKCSLKLEEQQGDGCHQVASKTLLLITQRGSERDEERANRRTDERKNSLPDDSQINTNEQTARQITGLTVNSPITDVQS